MQPSRSLQTILGYRLPAELEVELASTVPTLLVLQEYPDIATKALSGIVVPPHERTIMYQMHWGASSCVIVASRGTAKSSTAGVLYPNINALLYPRQSILELSATGFRGGQMMFLDAQRWIQGGWLDQEGELRFLRGSIPRQNILNRSQNYWEIEYDSFSRLMTLPTKDPDAIRGHRAHKVLVDEANFIERDLIDKVVLPFLNVKGDFKHGGAMSAGNQVFFVSTIDYNWRPFQDRIKAARDGVARDKAAVEAAAAQGWERYEELAHDGLCQHTFVKFDYTDLLIRRRITNRRGDTFEVSWPDEDIPLTYDPRGIPFLERDEQGGMKLHGSPLEYYQTYPLDKDGLERPLLDGSTDQGSWLSEQRNVVDTANGDVYSHGLMDRASCKGEYYILPYGKLPDAWQTLHADDQADYTAPVLWRCTDPCVLGVDYAPMSDFCAFVVIRMGPLAEGAFNPLTHHGQTTWSNVIWAEQHRRMSHREVADKIRELSERYNLYWYDDPRVTDPWEACRAIGMDMRGGGTGVRDELCFINDAAPPPGTYRIYDRFDKDERIAAFATDLTAKPMLDAIWPSDQLNDKLVEYTTGQFQQGLLYLAKYLPLSDRPRGQRELHIGYDAINSLDAQLRKLRQAPTKNWRTFFMEGDVSKDKNKKDLWAAFIYAAKQMRAHIIRKRQAERVIPPMGALVSRIGQGRVGNHGRRSAGARD